jgi:hypothetical protein
MAGNESIDLTTTASAIWRMGMPASIFCDIVRHAPLQPQKVAFGYDIFWFFLFLAIAERALNHPQQISVY